MTGFNKNRVKNMVPNLLDKSSQMKKYFTITDNGIPFHPVVNVTAVTSTLGTAGAHRLTFRLGI